MEKFCYSAVAIAAISIACGQVYTSTKVADVTKEVVYLREEVKQIKKEVKNMNEQYTLVKTNERIALNKKERHCLMKNMFHEAGVENIDGKIAVAQVTIERLNSGRWGTNICDVVYANAQFSWTLSKNKLSEQPSTELWKDVERALSKYESGYRIKEIKGVMFYHTDYIKPPKWAKKDKIVAKVGKHFFYEKIA